MGCVRCCRCYLRTIHHRGLEENGSPAQPGGRSRPAASPSWYAANAVLTRSCSSPVRRLRVASTPPMLTYIASIPLLAYRRLSWCSCIVATLIDLIITNAHQWIDMHGMPGSGACRGMHDSVLTMQCGHIHTEVRLEWIVSVPGAYYVNGTSNTKDAMFCRSSTVLSGEVSDFRQR